MPWLTFESLGGSASGLAYVKLPAAAHHRVGSRLCLGSSRKVCLWNYLEGLHIIWEYGYTYGFMHMHDLVLIAETEELLLNMRYNIKGIKEGRN